MLDALAEARERLGCADLRHLTGVPADLPAFLAVLVGDIRVRVQDDGVPDTEIADTCRLLLERYRGFFGFLLSTIEDGWGSWTTTCECAAARELVLRLAGAGHER